MTEAAPPVPSATYRLQFHRGFRFRDAAALAPYLARLGVSHVYASPYLKARPGSTHGYDIVDHGQLNPELGEAADFDAMVAAFRANNLGQVLDFVPNHMGVGGADNPWWLDVLEWGPDSDYAGWFDIDWGPDNPALRGKLLVPFLGDQYGAVLEAGQLELRFDAEAGSFAVWAYATHKLPICPLFYERVLGSAHPALERLGDAFSNLASWRPRVHARARDLELQLAGLVRDDPAVRAAVEAAVGQLNGEAGKPETWRALDALIRDQHWRVAHFRVAADDINYRRFFNINELAGLRMELPELFDHAHRFVFSLLQEGILDGLRIDHVDGLFDPKAYLLRLRERAPRSFYLVVEKILAGHEPLRDDWQVDGTTGYEFAALVLGLLVDPEGEGAQSRIYDDFIGGAQPFAGIVHECKRRILLNEMASELGVLALDAARVARQNPRTADFTRNILERALAELVASFPVYRSYIDRSAAPTEADRHVIDQAIAEARRREPDLDPSVFDFLARLVTTDLVATPRSGFSRQCVVRFAMRLQQLSGPVMAKGVEDTAFYRYNRFVALNEVGGDPARFGIPLAAFHEANAERARRLPHAMVATSTHDTKRGEDVRARLAVLAEMPEAWERELRALSRILRTRRGDVEGTAPPDRNDEYLFFQLLLGAWPAELTGIGIPDPAALGGFAERMEAALTKSLREAKRHTSWTAPNAVYEAAMAGFLRDALDPARGEDFLARFLPFQERIARLGFANTLVQTTLKLTVPGMPDFYQGSELWDLSLVDPDNRRPVDYALRRRLLDAVGEALARDRTAALSAMRRDWRDGRLKLAVIATLLDHRRRHPALYADGSYEPVAASGAKADRLVAFARRHGEATLLVVASRLPTRREADPDWGDSHLAAPPSTTPATRWLNLLTGERFAGTPTDPARLLRELPVAVLAADA